MEDQTEPTRAQLFLAAVGEQVLGYRETACLSHEDLARLTSLTAEQIDDLEHGWLDPTLMDMEAIAQAVGATVYELLDVAGSELGLTASDPHD